MSKERIVEFLTEMATQDRVATADVFYYTIQTRVLRETSKDNASVVKLFYNDEEYDDKDDIKMHVSPDEYFEDFIEYRYFCKEWNSRGMFLTKSDAENHLEANRHHYSSDAHVFVSHAWRAPKLKQFFEDLFEYFNVKKTNN